MARNESFRSLCKTAPWLLQEISDAPLPVVRSIDRVCPHAGKRPTRQMLGVATDDRFARTEITKAGPETHLPVPAG